MSTHKITKDQMMDELVKAGLDVAVAREAIELSLHAKNEAVETIHRIAATAPLGLSTLVGALALSCLAQSLSEEDVQEILSTMFAAGCAVALMKR